MEAAVTATTTAAVCAAIGGTLHYFSRAPKLVCWLYLLAGFGITGGVIGSTAAKVGGKLGEILNSTLAKLIGIGVPLVIIAIATTWLVVELGPRKKKGGATGHARGHAGDAKKLKKPTPWIALSYATLLAIVGGISIGTGTEVLVSIGSGMSDFATVFTGGLPANPTAPKPAATPKPAAPASPAAPAPAPAPGAGNP